MKFKNWVVLLILSTFILVGCKVFGRAAAKYWTQKQIKEFVNNCESTASQLVGEDKAKNYCDCAVDVVAEKYTNYEDVKKVSLLQVLKVAKSCIQEKE
jgi:hypothetical protein